MCVSFAIDRALAYLLKATMMLSRSNGEKLQKGKNEIWNETIFILAYLSYIIYCNELFKCQCVMNGLCFKICSFFCLHFPLFSLIPLHAFIWHCLIYFTDLLPTKLSVICILHAFRWISPLCHSISWIHTNFSQNSRHFQSKLFNVFLAFKMHLCM